MLTKSVWTKSVLTKSVWTKSVWTKSVCGGGGGRRRRRRRRRRDTESKTRTPHKVVGKKPSLSRNCREKNACLIFIPGAVGTYIILYMHILCVTINADRSARNVLRYASCPIFNAANAYKYNPAFCNSPRKLRRPATSSDIDTVPSCEAQQKIKEN